MEIPNKNQPDSLPYEKLALLGIDREKADMLPQDVKQKLMQGEVTPLLQVSIDTGNGSVITLPLKLQLAADKDGNIGFLRFMLESDNAESYLEWCELHGIEPSEESAEFYYDETEIDMMERQLIDDEDYGIWN